jgi:hypothetical protein
MPLSFSYLPLVVVVAVEVVVIARAALSARGNPETDKAFVVVFPSPLAGEGVSQSETR